MGLLCLLFGGQFFLTPGYAQVNDTCTIPEDDGSYRFHPPGDGIEEYFPINTENEDPVNILIIPAQYSNDAYEHCSEVLGGVNTTSGKPNMGSANYAADCANLSEDGWNTGDFQSGTDDQSLEWPADLPDIPDTEDRQRQRPTWMNSLVDPPGGGITDGSLTDYYNKMSNGRFELRGHVLDYVYVPEHTFLEYENGDPGLFSDGAVRLTHEIISYVIQEPGSIDLTDQSVWDTYTNSEGNNRQPDNKFDMIVLLFRQSHIGDISTEVNANNWSTLGSEESDAFDVSPLTVGNMSIVNGFHAGSGVISQAFTKKGALRIIAHEIGHRQFGAYHTDPASGGVLLPSSEKLIVHSMILEDSSYAKPVSEQRNYSKRASKKGGMAVFSHVSGRV
jgi:M6 family metalloprotease-like protein